MPTGIELKDYGRLRRDGELRLQSHETNATGVGKNAKARYLFVFDKVVLICKAARGDHYRYDDLLSRGKILSLHSRYLMAKTTTSGEHSPTQASDQTL